MFTNWLTGSSGTAPRAIGITAPPLAVAAAPLSSGIGSGGGIMSTPPDVILEVGPAPSAVRFVAHALVLGMHSGYLRSAIRMDESAAAAASGVASNNSSGTRTHGATGELLLYLGNVTADQFAPLLTYMYTGYLDLNVDNIFAVLLATHVLHMPRALEICRSFLARAQTEGYLNGNGNPPPQLCPTAPASAKIIRPIPSKATLPNFGFLPVPLPLAPPPPPATAATVPPPAVLPSYSSAASLLQVGPEYPGLDVAVDEEEDVEVFIDSNTVTDNENEDMEAEDCNVSVVSSLASSSAGSLNIELLETKPTTPTPTPNPTPTPKPQAPARTKKEPPAAAAAAMPRGSRSSAGGTRSGKAGRRSNASGLQVAKAPVPAAQLETATAAMPSKFIIDVASCDGPVRFRRILNTAYGHKPEGLDSGTEQCEQQRTQQSVSYSFHQQMARAISSQQRQQFHQQQQQQQHPQEESENSGDATGAAPANSRKQASAGASSSAATASSSSSIGIGGPAAASQELYVCVYCKHTFKSQYCYQKHAKRHLNPLSLASAEKKLVASADHGLVAMESSNTGQDNSQPQEATSTAAAATATAAAAGGSASTAATSMATTSALMRREVRPLDMNVQYYPCKTCGSKFPSYYFVHKHRKMCHADEIEAAAAATSNTSTSSSGATPGGGGGTGDSTKRETTVEPSEDQQQQPQP
ncbi:insulinoma-associated protein 1 [Drosophila obscura]|uniref:insulinoma-associated protein 1 n=1 Tax=Drosophila obscura TaxID=7282 RepID=UPI001BB26031|nr:insulinoma-associated protein 1 [Drosophila obscura]